MKNLIHSVLSRFVSKADSSVPDIYIPDQDFFQSIAHFSPVMLFIYDIQKQRNIWSNEMHRNFFRKILAKSPQSYDFTEIKSFIHQDDFAVLLEKVQQLTNDPHRQQISCEYRVKYQDNWRWILSNLGVFYRNQKGRAIQIISSALDITQQKEAEEKLLESEQNYRNLVELSPDGIIKLDLTGKILAVNQEFISTTGYDITDFVGKHFAKIPTSMPQSIGTYSSLLINIIKRNLDYVNFEWKHKDGTIHKAEARTKLVKNPHGNNYVQGIIRDITDSEEKNEALKLQEQKFQTLVDMMDEAVVIMKSRHCLYVNPALHKITGYDLKEFHCYRAWIKIDKKDRYALFKNYQKHLKGEILPAYDLKIPHKNGSILWINIQGSPVKWEYKSAVMYLISDVTVRKNIEIEALDRNKELNQVLEAIPDALIYADTQRRIVRVNNGFIKMFGYQPQEVCGKKTSLIYADPQDFRNQGILRYNAEARDVLEPYEIKYKRKNGEVFDSETSGTPVRDSGDNVIGLLGIIRDISKRKEAENKLKKSEDDFRNLFENSPVSLWEEDFSELKTFLDNLNPDIKQNLKQHFEENPGVLERCVGSIKINKVNKQTLRLYGISSQQHFISSLYKIFTEKSYQTFIEGVCWLYEKGSTFITETVQKTNDGNLIDVYFETSIAPGHEETWDKVYVSIIDITPQKKAENELREHRDHLKELVAEKTAEINEKYNELQHQYSIMVGREFRIKELRDTVKELRRKLRNYENNI